VSEEDSYVSPWIHLLFELDKRLDEHENHYRDATDSDEEQLYRALAIASEYAYEMIQDGAIPMNLTSALEWYLPDETIERKLRTLMQYNYLHRRAEFELGKQVIGRLQDAEKRIQILALIFSVLRARSTSITAVNYLRQASQLYLAGYTAEVFIMCGATLEAALAEVIPDDLVQKTIGEKPKFRASGVYSVGQRMKAEKQLASPIFADFERDQFWQVVNSRNDTVHVQLGLADEPEQMLLLVAYTLARMFRA
jgi:hypothetical protein